MDILTVEQIAERIWLSIADRRLRPGTRLKETELAEIFGISRARVRQVLALLEREGLVVIESHKGAVVAKPSVTDAEDIFHIRATVEQRVLERLMMQLDSAKLVEMFEHVAKERIANNNNNQRDIIKLSGGFHVLLAEMAEAEFLTGMMRDLVSRTSLIMAAFRDSNMHNCGPDEHEHILIHLKNGNLEAAKQAMVDHLEHVESALNLLQDRDSPKNLRDALI
ncbi:GntR family transcriptional regulator [Paracoccus aerius]|uniref:GntR family transcriptional regulator n=1 Tax=Paracoccus aerius TaxID=1915382 RepID=A0ABS1SCF7_9RHOB|nr:GntR family transcriptional regulator [Paracoccus aerius]MBL3675352.1 GntR family transcriptional regulator [Paracoccus aerius]GHG32755.1 GntR family transcriptional regulator [Paracoccus aerius]